MSAKILDGTAASDALLAGVRAAIESRPAGLRPPVLAAVLVGDDPASQVYVRNKIRACKRVGIESRLESLAANTSAVELQARLAALSHDAGVDGILLQLPLPAPLDARRALEAMEPAKDVDGLHAVNLGKLVADDDSGFQPCTPAGIVWMLAHFDIDVEGRHVLVVGRSALVGRPLALLLLRRTPGGNATVTVAHTKSANLPALVGTTDIVVAAAGVPELVQGAWLRPGAVVVDVGIHRRPGDGGKDRLVGDVHFASAARVASAITPVPGGVGPMTVAMLMRNTLLAWQRRHGVADGGPRRSEAR
jgi:methylenetetrahydrofolate dehydrogenase (NADP+)/methenyltetrahydrofolate cyclohydrolase